MHDDEMPTGSELFESDNRVGRHSFLALASTLLLGLFAGASAHAEAAPAKTQGGGDAKRRKKAAAATTQHPTSRKNGGGTDMRKKKKA